MCQRSISGTRAVRIDPRARIQRLFPAGIRCQTRVLIDRDSAEEQGFGWQPSPSGECRLGLLPRFVGRRMLRLNHAGRRQ